MRRLVMHCAVAGPTVSVAAAVAAVSYQRRGIAGRCPFSTLGLPKSATKSEVKAQYKKLAKEHHPDKGGCKEKFREVKDAYESCNKIIDENDIFDRVDRDAKPRQGHHSEPGNNDPERDRDKARHTASGSREEQASDGSTNYYRSADEFVHSAFCNDPYSEDYRSDPNSVFTDKERRRKLCDLFDQAATADEVDAVLTHCLTSKIFDNIDIGEPLLRALSRFHCVGIPLGEVHIARCVKAVDTWEHWHRRKAPQSYFHPIMVIYSDPGATHDVPALDVSQGVSNLLEFVEAKGYMPDDLMMTLAGRIFRTSPLPDW